MNANPSPCAVPVKANPPTNGGELPKRLRQRDFDTGVDTIDGASRIG